MKQLVEVKKEDDVYFQGAFWIKGDSVKDIIRGNFELICEKRLCDFNGKDVNILASKNSLTHKNLWKNEFGAQHGNKSFDYYPRGRVSIYKGTAFIHIHSILHTPAIVDAIINEYGIDKLDVEVERNDLLQGSHYDFLLD